MKSWRKGWFLNRYCHLVIRAVRVDSPPYKNGQQLTEMLVEHRKRFKSTREAMAAGLGFSLGTLKNWECCRTKPAEQFWSKIRKLDQRPVPFIRPNSPPSF